MQDSRMEYVMTGPGVNDTVQNIPSCMGGGREKEDAALVSADNRNQHRLRRIPYRSSSRASPIISYVAKGRISAI